MRLIGKKLLLKAKKKNIGNKLLCLAIDKLIEDLERFVSSKEDMYMLRADMDCVHSEGFYFFNIHIHRTLVLIEFDEEGEATILWVGAHQEYESIFNPNYALAKYCKAILLHSSFISSKTIL
ncbi:type II toxin-antitoxin system HigB family toxin [Myroides odoratimimus]|uniref:type II toxin-antitoxin system HigB family toxin n=1 Tax=Myroides odoratimimus TaxID=76832 RepID=UPI00046863C7|nr:type II toxin-antitoxin system HigB family toxin [Myroides odoratimimus]